MEPNFQRPQVDPRNHPDAEQGRMYLPYRQERAPPGGYPSIPALRYKPWNYNGFIVWGLFLGISAFGHYKIYKGSANIRFVQAPSPFCIRPWAKWTFC